MMEPLNGIDVVYYINMDKSTDRKQYMETDVFADPIFDSIPIKRIHGVDGNSEEVTNYLKNDSPLSGELGCLLSHLNAIQKFNESQYETALIFEDDVSIEFKSKWKKTLREIMDESPTDWDILQLAYIGTIPTTDYDKPRASAAAYLIQKRGATKIMELSKLDKTSGKYVLDSDFYKNNTVADYFIYNSPNINAYCYKYPMFTYRDDNDSTLHSDHLANHVESKKNTKVLLDIEGFISRTREHSSLYLVSLLILLTVMYLISFKKVRICVKKYIQRFLNKLNW